MNEPPHLAKGKIKDVAVSVLMPKNSNQPAGDGGSSEEEK
jgi:hypothetical protein